MYGGGIPRKRHCNRVGDIDASHGNVLLVEKGEFDGRFNKRQDLLQASIQRTNIDSSIPTQLMVHALQYGGLFGSLKHFDLDGSQLVLGRLRYQREIVLLD